jgi:hypothetical protein
VKSRQLVENLAGFPEEWETNAPAFIKIDFQMPSRTEHGEQL